MDQWEYAELRWDGGLGKGTWALTTEHGVHPMHEPATQGNINISAVLTHLGRQGWDATPIYRPTQAPLQWYFLKRRLA